MGSLIALGGFFAGSFLGGSAAAALGATGLVVSAASFITGTLVATWLGGAISPSKNPPSEMESERKFQDLKYTSFQQNNSVPITHGVVYTSGTVIMIGKNRADLRQVGENTYEVQSGKDGTETRSQAVKQPFYQLDALLAISEGPIEEVMRLDFQDYDVTHLEGDVNTGWLLFRGDVDENIEQDYPNFWARMASVIDDTIPFRSTAKIGWYGDIGTANSLPRITAVIKGRRGTYDSGEQDVTYSQALSDTWFHYDPDAEEIVCVLSDKNAVVSFNRVGGSMTTTTPSGSLSVLFGVSWSWSDRFVIYEDDSSDRKVLVGRRGYTSGSSWVTKLATNAHFDATVLGYVVDIHHGIVYTLHMVDSEHLYLFGFDIESGTFTEWDVSSSLAAVGYDKDNEFVFSDFVGMYYDYETDNLYFALHYYVVTYHIGVVKVDISEYSNFITCYTLEDIHASNPHGLLKSGDVFITCDIDQTISSAVVGDVLVFENDFTSTVSSWNSKLKMPSGWNTYLLHSTTVSSSGFWVTQDSSDILYSTTARGEPNHSYLSIFVPQQAGQAIDTFTDWSELLQRNTEFNLLDIVKKLPEDVLWIKTNHNGRDGWVRYSEDTFGAVPFASSDQKVVAIVSVEPPYENHNVSVGVALRATYGDVVEYYYATVTRQGNGEDTGGMIFEIGCYFDGTKSVIASTDATSYVYNTAYKPRQPLMFKVEVEDDTTDRLKLWYGTSNEDDDPILNTTLTGSVAVALRVVEGPNAIPNAYAGIISSSISYKEDGSDETLYSYGRIFSVSFYNVDVEVPAHFIIERFSLSDDYQPDPVTVPIYEGDPRLLDDTEAGRYWRQTATYGAKRDWHNRATFDVVSLTKPSNVVADPWTGYLFIRDQVDSDWVFVYTRWNREDWSYTSKSAWRQRIFTALHSGPGWIFDILTNSTFGMGIDLRDPTVSIDKSSFEEAEGHCLEQVLVRGDDDEFYYEDRYQIDGVIDSRSSGASHIQKIASNFNAYITETDGTIRLVQLRPMRRIDRSFDRASIKFDGDEATISGSSDDVFSRPNEIVSEFRDSEESFRYFPEREFDEYAQEWFGIPEFPFRNVRNVAREFVNRRSQNIRMNRYDLQAAALLDSRVSFVTDIRACDLKVGSFITVTYSALGYESQLMQLASLEESLDTDGGIEYVLDCVPFSSDVFNVSDADFVIPSQTPNIVVGDEVFPVGLFLCARDYYSARYIFAFGLVADGGRVTAVSLQRKTGTVSLNTKSGFVFTSLPNGYLTPCGLVHDVAMEESGTRTLILINPNGELSPIRGQLFIRRWFENVNTHLIEYAISPIEYGIIDEVSLSDHAEFISPRPTFNVEHMDNLTYPALLFLRNVRDPSRGTYYLGVRLIGEGPHPLVISNYLKQDYELYLPDEEEDYQFSKSHQYSVAYVRQQSGWKTIAERLDDNGETPQFVSTDGAAWFVGSDPWEIDIVSDRPFNFIEVLPNIRTYGPLQDYSLSDVPIKMEIDRAYFWDGEEEKWKRVWNIVDGTDGMRYTYHDGEFHYGTGISFALPYWPIRPFYPDMIINESSAPVMYYRLEEEDRVFSSSVASDRYASENAHDQVGITSKVAGGLTYHQQPFRSTSSRIGYVPFLNSSRNISGDDYDPYHGGGGHGTFVLPIYTNAMNRCPLYSHARSIECWFKIDSDTVLTRHGLWGYGGVNQDISESFISSNGKYFSCYYYNNQIIVDCGRSQPYEDDWKVISTDTTKFNQFGWNHVVVTAYGHRVDIYANGYWVGGGDLPSNLATMVSTKAYDDNDFGVSNIGQKFIIGATMPIDDARIDTSGDQPDMFGASYTQYVLDGCIDEVAVYDYVLTARKILDHYLVGVGLYMDGGGPWGRISSGDFIYAAHDVSSSPTDTTYSDLDSLRASGLSSGVVNLANRKSYVYVDGDWREYEPDYDYEDPEDYPRWPSYTRPDGVEDWGAYVIRLILKKPATIADDAVIQNGFIRTSLRPEFVVHNDLNQIVVANGQSIPFEGESFACQSHGSSGQVLQDFRLSPKYYVPYAANIEEGNVRTYFESLTDIDAFKAVGLSADGKLVSANGDYDNFVPAIGVLLSPVFANRWNSVKIAYNGQVVENFDWGWIVPEDSQGFIPIYLDTNISGYTSSGNLTQTKPSGDLVQQIGVAITSTTMIVKVELGYGHGHIYGEELTGVIDGSNTEFTTLHPFFGGSVCVYWAVNDSGGLKVIKEIDSYGYVEYDNHTLIMQNPPFVGVNDYGEYESQKLYADYEVDYSVGTLSL